MFIGQAQKGFTKSKRFHFPNPNLQHEVQTFVTHNNPEIYIKFSVESGIYMHLSQDTIYYPKFK